MCKKNRHCTIIATFLEWHLLFNRNVHVTERQSNGVLGVWIALTSQTQHNQEFRGQQPVARATSVRNLQYGRAKLLCSLSRDCTLKNFISKQKILWTKKAKEKYKMKNSFSHSWCIVFQTGTQPMTIYTLCARYYKLISVCARTRQWDAENDF